MELPEKPLLGRRCSSLRRVAHLSTTMCLLPFVHTGVAPPLATAVAGETDAALLMQKHRCATVATLVAADSNAVSSM
jgi:hypothetical protein